MIAERYILAAHIISMVCWYAAIFYLPRLFIYHVECPADDRRGQARFEIMERRLYRGIMWPAAIATTLFGVWLLSYRWDYYLHATWMQIKLFCVLILWGYHLYCGSLRKQFINQTMRWSSFGLRCFNEVPTILLIIIIIAAIVYSQ